MFLREFWMTPLRFVLLLLPLLYPPCFGRLTAQTGGTVQWTLPIAEAGPISINAIGDDGVVLIGVDRSTHREVRCDAFGRPTLSQPRSGNPFARVAGATYSASGSTIIVEPDGAPAIPIASGVSPRWDLRLAIGAKGDIYGAIMALDGAYYRKWSPTGILLAETRLPDFPTNPGWQILLDDDESAFLSCSTPTTPVTMLFDRNGRRLWNSWKPIYTLAPLCRSNIWALDAFVRQVVTDRTGFVRSIPKAAPHWITKGNAFVSSPAASQPYAYGLLADGSVVGPVDRDGKVLARVSPEGAVLWSIDANIPGGNGAYFIGRTTMLILEHPQNQLWILRSVAMGGSLLQSPVPISYARMGRPDGSNRIMTSGGAETSVSFVGLYPQVGGLVTAGTEPGHRYRFETAVDLSGPWKSLGEVSPTGFGSQWIDPITGNPPSRLYRVVDLGN